MTGILVIAHGNLARELVKVATFILEEEEGVFPLDIDPTEAPEGIRDRIEEALRQADQGQGVLILTDLFGGTPSNFGLAFLEEGRVEVVSGVNLPMLIKALQHRELPPGDLAALVTEAGRKAIVRSSVFLEG
ncbi:PTS sugar transporter subunit IIA [Thermosulfurimonas sp. F29]|uniref:PTS sugar transporter subunit IIA n=1 Tax=Thermosulfurimonas sp. F29 TaxID=2867247 RepID=UPI001C837E0D|nr:PTS sugar transporter subunit IIA [Thermosulfurimonas sp. F29]MBX6423133.1 PTS sugar transporter subunit IIA [Thermosulfurimonas sp. F29]